MLVAVAYEPGRKIRDIKYLAILKRRVAR